MGAKVERARLVRRVKPDRFHGDGHGDIWAAITELDRRDLEYDATTLIQLSGGKVDAAYLATVHQTCTVPLNIGHHVEMLEWDHARAQAVGGPLASFLEALRDPLTHPERVRSLARSLGTSFDGHGDRKYLRDPNRLVADHMVEVRKRRQVQACFPFGLDTLDKAEDGTYRLVPGAKGGLITVVTGVPGSGKSTLIARLVLGLARQRRRVLYGPWEMGDGVTLELLAGMSLRWSRYKLSTGQITDVEEAQLEQRMIDISAYVRFVAMPFGRTPGERISNEQALDTLHGYISDSGCDVFVADLWKRALRYTDPDDEERALVRQQAIAQETGVHCILAQQQRLKDVEQRRDKRPTREGIKGSGAWVEVADTIMGVHRPALWKPIPDVSVEVDILKQRFGKWPLAVEFDWNADSGSIDNGRTVDYDAHGSTSSSELDDFVHGGSKNGKK